MGESLEQYKMQAAVKAAGRVESGMRLGLGAGSTAACFLKVLSDKLGNGALKHISGVPASSDVALLAAELGIPLTSLGKAPVLDLTVDGADEVDINGSLIKGGGGALLREKILAQASRQEVIIADHTKLSDSLGEKWPLPVEVLPFGWQTQRGFLENLGAKCSLRKDKQGRAFLSDNANYILDCDFGVINDPSALALELDGRAGVLGHGLFIGLADEVIIAGPEGLRSIKGRA